MNSLPLSESIPSSGKGRCFFRRSRKDFTDIPTILPGEFTHYEIKSCTFCQFGIIHFIRFFGNQFAHNVVKSDFRHNMRCFFLTNFLNPCYCFNAISACFIKPTLPQKYSLGDNLCIYLPFSGRNKRLIFLVRGARFRSCLFFSTIDTLKKLSLCVPYGIPYGGHMVV